MGWNSGLWSVCGSADRFPGAGAGSDLLLTTHPAAAPQLILVGFSAVGIEGTLAGRCELVLLGVVVVEGRKTRGTT